MDYRVALSQASAWMWRYINAEVCNAYVESGPLSDFLQCGIETKIIGVIKTMHACLPASINHSLGASPPLHPPPPTPSPLSRSPLSSDCRPHPLPIHCAPVLPRMNSHYNILRRTRRQSFVQIDLQYDTGIDHVIQ